MKRSLNRKVALFGAAIAGAVAINGNAECMSEKHAPGAFRAGAGAGAAAPVSATVSAVNVRDELLHKAAVRHSNRGHADLAPQKAAIHARLENLVNFIRGETQLVDDKVYVPYTRRINRCFLGRLLRLETQAPQTKREQPY